MTGNYKGGWDERAACCWRQRIAKGVCCADVWVAVRVAKDLGKTCLGSVYDISKYDDAGVTENILIPPLKKGHRCFPCLWGVVGLKIVNNELPKFPIMEPIIVLVPNGGICESEVELKVGR